MVAAYTPNPQSRTAAILEMLEDGPMTASAIATSLDIASPLVPGSLTTPIRHGLVVKTFVNGLVTFSLSAPAAKRVDDGRPIRLFRTAREASEGVKPSAEAIALANPFGDRQSRLRPPPPKAPKHEPQLPSIAWAVAIDQEIHFKVGDVVFRVDRDVIANAMLTKESA